MFDVTTDVEASIFYLMRFDPFHEDALGRVRICQQNNRSMLRKFKVVDCQVKTLHYYRGGGLWEDYLHISNKIMGGV